MTNLPSYLAEARPVPMADRAPWSKTIAPVYIGVTLWYLFWSGLSNGGLDSPAPGGVLINGFFYPFLGMAIAAIICHFLFYLTPGLLGMRTGMPLCVVGTSTYGAQGGRFLPGLLMALMQFGWLAVVASTVAAALCTALHIGLGPDGFVSAVPVWPQSLFVAAFAVVAMAIGLSGMKPLARVATYLPLIPVVVLLFLLAITCTGLGGFDWVKLFPDTYSRERAITDAWGNWQIVGILCTYVVGFFAIAGAAGADVASNARGVEDVHIGGTMGILLPTVLAGEIGMLVVAGAYGAAMIPREHMGDFNPVQLMSDIYAFRFGVVWGGRLTDMTMIALAISALPLGCFSMFVAANNLKTALPGFKPWLPVSVGTAGAIAVAVAGWAVDLTAAFTLAGAAFGPVCGAMMADYLMSGCKWSGPRAGFNPAGWISWIAGFVVGGQAVLLRSDWVASEMPFLTTWDVPVPPVAAFVVGFGVYVALSVFRLRTRRLVG